MSYLTRLREKIHAADPRPPASNQVDTGDEEPIEDKKEPEGKTEEPEAEKTEEPEAGKKKEPEEPAKGNELPTGKTQQKKEGRFAEIKAFKPYLLVITGMDAVGALLKFFQETSSIINDPKLVERIAGPGSISGTTEGPLNLTFAYLIAEKAMKELTAKASGGLLAYTEAFDKKMGSAMPFQALGLPSEMKAKIGADNEMLLRKKMQKSYDALRSEDAGETIGAVSALQFASVIPLDYMRWLDKANKPHSFYMGGYPDDAGRVGMIYVICTEAESRLFLKTLKEFHPLPNFVDDLHFISNIDSGFKSTKPKTVTVDNCLILEAKDKFKLNEKLDEQEGKQQLAASIVAKIDSAQERVRQREEQRPKLKSVKKEHTVMEALNNAANDISKQNLVPGKFVKGTHVQGNLVAHFSADMKRCILWCGHKPLDLSKELEDSLMETFDLSRIDTTFSK